MIARKRIAAKCACAPSRGLTALRGVAWEMRSFCRLQPTLSLDAARRTARQCGRRWLAFKKSDDPISFSRSGARTFRIVDDSIMTGPVEQKRGRYAIPLGLVTFAALVYLGFIREETTSDKSVFTPPTVVQQPTGIPASHLHSYNIPLPCSIFTVYRSRHRQWRQELKINAASHLILKHSIVPEMLQLSTYFIQQKIKSQSKTFHQFPAVACSEKERGWVGEWRKKKGKEK